MDRSASHSCTGNPRLCGKVSRTLRPRGPPDSGTPGAALVRDPRHRAPAPVTLTCALSPGPPLRSHGTHRARTRLPQEAVPSPASAATRPHTPRRPRAAGRVQPPPPVRQAAAGSRDAPLSPKQLPALWLQKARCPPEAGASSAARAPGEGSRDPAGRCRSGPPHRGLGTATLSSCRGPWCRTETSSRPFGYPNYRTPLEASRAQGILGVPLPASAKLGMRRRLPEAPDAEAWVPAPVHRGSQASCGTQAREGVGGAQGSEAEPWE